MTGNNIIYFDSFGTEHILKEIKKVIGNKDIINILRHHNKNHRKQRHHNKYL